jgi:hypothetical protein
MYLTPTIQRGLIIGGVSVLAIAAGVGLTRTTRTSDPVPLVTSEPVASRPSGAGEVPAVYAASPFTSRYSDPAPAPVSAAPPPAPLSYVAPGTPGEASITPVVARRYVARRNRARRRRRVVVVRRRPFSHSAAIVGGSAAGGAAVGALAGGGKGALAGALVGGTGGLIYDRVTHKKRRVVTR